MVALGCGPWHEADLANVGLACDIPYKYVLLNTLIVGPVAGQHGNVRVKNGHKASAAVVQPLYKLLHRSWHTWSSNLFMSSNHFMCVLPCQADTGTG